MRDRRDRFALAVNQVRAGAADVALAVGVERMNADDPERTMAVFDVADPDALARTLLELGGEADEASSGRRSIFMDIHAAVARNHMRLYGTSQEQLAAKNHDHATANPRAHHRKPMTVADVLGARKLSYPLTVPMCAAGHRRRRRGRRVRRSRAPTARRAAARSRRHGRCGRRRTDGWDDRRAEGGDEHPPRAAARSSSSRARRRTPSSTPSNGAGARRWSSRRR